MFEVLKIGYLLLWFNLNEKHSWTLQLEYIYCIQHTYKSKCLCFFKYSCILYTYQSKVFFTDTFVQYFVRIICEPIVLSYQVTLITVVDPLIIYTWNNNNSNEEDLRAFDNQAIYVISWYDSQQTIWKLCQLCR